MFENMSGFVGYAMHDDLLLRARKDARRAEAERTLKGRRQRMATQSYRASLARILFALAARLAPVAT